jgi:hypothetical protein
MILIELENVVQSRARDAALVVAPDHRSYNTAVFIS